jgi:hypothetical protein
MRTFESIDLDKVTLSRELDEFADFLQAKSELKEREHIAPFFKERRQLCAALGLVNGSVELVDRVAIELELFGDFACDAASGDSQANAYTLVEFEDARRYSVLSRLEPGKTMKRWSSRFEHGFSQLVDWAWRLSTEGASTDAYRRIFGRNDADIHMLLVVGRDADLTSDDLARIRWRAQSISMGGVRMTCLTFDGVLNTLRRRILLASQET